MFTGIRNSARSLGATISVRAVRDTAFKNCCLRSGRFDGSKRNHFFPRVVINQFPAGRRTWVTSVKGQLPRSPTCPHFQICSRRREEAETSRANPVRLLTSAATQERKPSWLSTTQRFSTAARRRSRTRFRVRARFVTQAAASRFKNTKKQQRERRHPRPLALQTVSNCQLFL